MLRMVAAVSVLGWFGDYVAVFGGDCWILGCCGLALCVGSLFTCVLWLPVACCGILMRRLVCDVSFVWV